MRAWRIAIQPAGSVPAGATQPDVVPALPAEQPQGGFFGLRDWGYGAAIEWRFTHGGYNTLGPAAVWSRVQIPLVAGEPLRPLERLLLVADSANGISGELPMREWLFVPPSLSLALQRYPAGEWTFMDARTSLSADGLGVTRRGMPTRRDARHRQPGAADRASLGAFVPTDVRWSASCGAAGRPPRLP